MTFIATMVPAERWRSGEPSWKQSFWGEHATFINSLQEDGVLYMAGPLHDYSSLIQILEGEREAVMSRIQADPWVLQNVVKVFSLESWDVLMDPRTGYSWKPPAD
jgi:uncharacterized protein YciI